MHLPERDLQRLLAEEPFVRELARQLVAGEADEVVQRTWLRATQNGGAGVEQPRHWLARILRNVVANLRRENRRRAARERRTALQDLVPSSQELAMREESRRALVAAVDALPAPLRTVVLLRWFDGRPPREIAAALGVPVATVSTQLHRALGLLRQRLDAEHGGDRRAWMLPLVPFAQRPELPAARPAPAAPTAPVTPALLFEAITMTLKTKLAAAAGALALLAGAWFVLQAQRPPAPTLPATNPPATATLQRSAFAEPAVDSTPVATGEREPAPDTAATHDARFGTVIARVLHHDRTPAAGKTISLRERGSDVLFDGARVPCDATGAARFEDVVPGRFVVAYDGTWADTSKRIEVAAGQTVEVEIQLEAGLEVRGVVVDTRKQPVAGALVELAMMARGDSFPEVAAVTGADGRFVLRDCPELCLVGARAKGHVASNVRFLHGKKGNTAEIELVLGCCGGSVGGVVVDADGRPVRGAVVIVGDGEVSGIPGRDRIPPFGGLTRSGAQGEFLVVGVAAGKQPIRVRGGRNAPWLGEIEVADGAHVVQRIQLVPGAVVRGTVVASTGTPVARAEVEIGEWGEIAHFHTVTNTDGTFELRGLPSGEVTVRAEHDDHGKARASVPTTPNSEVSCTLTLSRGLELKGLVVDENDQPIEDAVIQCIGEELAPNRWYAFARTDAQGRFVAANRPPTGTFVLTVNAEGREERVARGVDPNREIVLRLRRSPPATVHMHGRIVDPAGRPVANAAAHGHRQDGRGGSIHGFTDNDGRFEIGPFPHGTWSVAVRATGFPDVRMAPRTLDPDATCDLGTITLQRGGTVLVRTVGEASDEPRFVVTDAARTQTFGVVTVSGQRRSEILAPGDYLLLVTGKNVAATTVPFTVRAGEEGTVDAPLEAASPQAFRCEVPMGSEVDVAMVQLYRGERFVGRTSVDVNSKEPSGHLGLAPGEYRATVEVGALRGRAVFVVGASSGPAVTIVLR